MTDFKAGDEVEVPGGVRGSVTGPRTVDGVELIHVTLGGPEALVPAAALKRVTKTADAKRAGRED